eukprot:s666_g10.t1
MKIGQAAPEGGPSGPLLGRSFGRGRPSGDNNASRNEWATVGITKSFLARPSVGGEQANSAMKALRELQRVGTPNLKLIWL